MQGYIKDQEQPDGSIVEGPGSVAHFKFFSPRIGFNFEVTNDGKTMLRANWGRYYQVPPTGMFSALNPALSSVKYANEINGEWVVYRENDYVARNQDPDLKQYYNDLLTISIEREIFKNASININYIKRWSGNYYGSIPLHDYAPITVTDSYTGEPITVYEQTSPSDFYFANIPDEYNFYDTYDAFQIVFNKRYSNRWYLNMSYHYEKSWGTTENGYNPDLSTGYLHYGVTVNPNNMINWEGNPMFHSPHQFKMTASYLLPWDITASTFIFYKSGNPYNRIHTINTVDVYAQFNAEPRGSNRMPSQFNIDFFLRKEFTLKDTIRLEVSAQVVNLLNSDTINGYYVQTGTYLEAYYGQNRSVVAPRQAVLGVRLRF